MIGLKQYYENKKCYSQLDTKNGKIVSTFDDIKKRLKLDRENEVPIIYFQKLITDLFNHVYDEAKKIIDDNNLKQIDIVKEKLQVLNRLAQCLHRFIDIHKTSKVSSFRPLFEDSFYKLDAKKLIEATERDGIIFFASAGLPPIKIKELEEQEKNFTYKTDRLYFRWTSLINDKAKEDIAEREKIVDDKIKKVDNDIVETKRHQVLTLGIFGGLLAFVVGSVSFFGKHGGENMTIKPVELILYYGIFALILVLGLGLFALFLKLLFEKCCENNDKSENKKKCRSQKILLGIVLGIVGLFVFTIICLSSFTNS